LALLAPPPADELQKARAGDSAAFAALLARHQKLVYSVALRMLGNRDSAEDMVQEVFIQLHGKLAEISSEEHLLFWLRRVSAHRAIDQLRRNSLLRLVGLRPDEEPIEDEGVDPLWQRQLAHHVRELNPVARAVLVLRYQQDLDPTEIALTLKMPLNTVKSHLKRSLQLLRERLGVADSGGDLHEG
jgi:RNA polymerase sigma-70 factor (ECF subfamily)